VRSRAFFKAHLSFGERTVIDALAVASGFGIGAVVGMTGVGGGSLMTPLLIGVFRLNPAVAIGTDLWFAAITKTSGSIAHHRHGHVDYRILSLLLAGSIPAAIGTIAWMHMVGMDKKAMAALTFALGIALLLTALTVASRSVWLRVGLKLDAWVPPSRKPLLTVAAGLVLGVLVSLSSIGAGAIGATLILTCPRRSWSAPTSRMRCRSRWWPASAMPRWATSRGSCWALCSSARCRASGSAPSSPRPCPKGSSVRCCAYRS
jgi:hypothetical protein